MAWNILVAVRDDFHRTLISGTLRSELYNIESVATGKDTLEQVVTKRFDLIICDQDLPHVTGEQIAAVSIAARHQTRFILLTSAPGLFERLPKGVDSIVRMPVTMQDLMQTIAVVME